jgi:hypothetical protein
MTHSDVGRISSRKKNKDAKKGKLSGNVSTRSSSRQTTSEKNSISGT